MIPRIALAVLASLAVACGSASSGAHPEEPRAPSAPPEMETSIEALRARCHAMDGQREACTADRACMVGRPMGGCSGGVCTQGGPVACLPCSDWVALTGRGSPELCALRAEGRDREACELLHPDEPARCAPPSAP